MAYRPAPTWPRPGTRGWPPCIPEGPGKKEEMEQPAGALSGAIRVDQCVKAEGDGGELSGEQFGQRIHKLPVRLWYFLHFPVFQ